MNTCSYNESFKWRFECAQADAAFWWNGSITRNVNRKTSNLRFFEIGKCYRVDAKQQNAGGKDEEQTAKTVNRYSESYHLGLWITGKRVENNWAHPNEESSVFELKGYVQDILVRLGLSFKGLKTEESTNNLFSKGLRFKRQKR